MTEAIRTIPSSSCLKRERERDVCLENISGGKGSGRRGLKDERRDGVLLVSGSQYIGIHKQGI